MCVAAFALFLWLNTVTWYIFIGILVVSIASWVLLVRVMVRSVRDTLYYQKIFISNVSHELRTPLSTIKTSTEVALLDEKLPASVRRTLADIVGELNRASEIINNLLSLNIFNRPERIEFQNMDLGPLVDAAVQQLSSLARERNIQIVVKKDNYRIVWGNATALEQVMINLIKNAISYTPKNSGGMVTISAYPDYQGSIIFSVADTGIGISQKDLFHIFEPFYRADTSRVRNINKIGSGLGLTIVNEIVRKHHGKINIQSKPRSGTTVSVLLPSGLEPGASPMPGAEHQAGSEITMDFSKKTI
ncbi:MAG: histidine kinase [Parcubacteria group bacterium Gr01-1014_56]|nr:MAG: histidine kinase [Parcubacteria group bacterium Gr01-1014_56]